MTHKCYCGVDYECPYCGNGSIAYICPTVNADEDANMCNACIEEFAEDYQHWYDTQEDE